RIHRRLTTAAAEWANANQEASFLATGARLDRFVDFAAHANLALNEEESAFLRASREEREKQRELDNTRKLSEEKIAGQARNFGRAAVALAIVGLFAVIATVVAIVQAADARAQVVNAAQTLTPIAQQIEYGSEQMESLRLGAEASGILQADDGNVET